MVEKVSMGVVLQMVAQNDEKHEAGHTRLRLDHRDIERRVMALERAFTDNALDFTRLKADLDNDRKILAKQAEAPIDVGKLVGNWKAILAIAAVIATNLAGNWFSNTPVRESQTKLQESFSVSQEHIEGWTKLQDTRTNAIKDSVDGLNRQMEMRRLEIQSLANEVQQLRRGR